MTYLAPDEAARLLADAPERAAPRLLGSLLHGPDAVVVRIVEVEAYGSEGEDPASHAFRGHSARNQAMFGPVGRLYAYRSYGIHTCLNVVAHPDGQAGGVLLRAAHVVVGTDVARRGRHHLAEALLASGPGRLGDAMGYALADSGAELLSAGALQLPAEPAAQIASGPRVGISRAVDRPWRFWLRGEPAVTRYRPGRRMSDVQEGNRP